MGGLAKAGQAEGHEVAPAIHEPAIDQERELAAHPHRQEAQLQGGDVLSRPDVGGLEYPLQALLAPLLQFDHHHMVQESLETPALLFGLGAVSL